MTLKPKRDPRLKLSKVDLAELKRLKRQKLRSRTWRRILTLEHLDAGMSIRAAARAVGGYHREVKRVADRYVQAGLPAALGDEPRPGPERKLDSVEQAAVVAMVCGPLWRTTTSSRGGKKWVVPEINGEFVERMEDVLRVYARPYDPKQPVVCLDERPVVLRDSARTGTPTRRGRIARSDY